MSDKDKRVVQAAIAWVQNPSEVEAEALVEAVNARKVKQISGGLYLLTWALTQENSKQPPLDCTHSVLVRAESEKAARKLASRKSGDEGEDFWLNSRRSVCTLLPESGPVGIIHYGVR